ncbi:endonuclease/exonuclease/phosphatase family protein [Thalassiella azotivora]
MATWNILNGTSLHDRRVEAARLHDAVRVLDVDVLGLQEVDRDQPRSGRLDLTAEVADALGAPHWRFVPAVVGTPGETWREATDDDQERRGHRHYGVGLVSRLPVVSWHHLRLPAARVRAPILLPGHSRPLLWLRDEPRVAVAAVVRAPVGLVTVACTHLSFVPGWNVRQLRRLARWLSGAPGPHLLVGDLNLPAGAAERVSGFRALARHATFPAPAPRVQLDHVLGRGALPPVHASATHDLPVSDHKALSVHLSATG